MWMLRVKRFAAAIDMTAAGTKPIPMAARIPTAHVAETVASVMLLELACHAQVAALANIERPPYLGAYEHISLQHATTDDGAGGSRDSCSRRRSGRAISGRY